MCSDSDLSATCHARVAATSLIEDDGEGAR